MNESDKNQFKTLMVGAGEIYNKEITKPLVQIYFSSLGEYSIDDVSKAFNDHLLDAEHGTFFPKPADIARLINKNQPTVEEQARLAWMEIKGKIATIGIYGTLKIKDQMALAALRNVGGWKKLCSSNESDLTWMEKDFVAAYQSFEKTPLELLPSSLPGLEEIHNAKLKGTGGMKMITDGLVKYKAKQLVNKGE